MAKLPKDISNRQVIQLLRTSGSSEHVSAVLSGSAASGEIAIQIPEQASATSLWTLAKDGQTAVQFVNKEQVADMIKNGAVAEVDKIEQAVGLADDGTYRPKTGTHYLSGATTVEGEIDALDKALNGVQDQINGMDAASVAGEDKIVSDVTQANGQITASVKNLTDVKLGGYTVGGDNSGKVADTDTLGQALGKLQGQINGMDKAASAADGQVVTTISEEDGKVSEVKANVKDLQLGGYEKDTTATGAIAGTDTINAALSKLENKANAITISNDDKSINVTSGADGTVINVNIKEGEKVIRKDGNGGLYTNLNLVKVSEKLPATVKERYELRDSDNHRIGESIDIAKDSHIVSIRYITDSSDEHYQNLEYNYIDAEGNTKTVYVDMSSLVLETEFKSGVTATDGIVHGVVDPQSEAFLSVGADGFKLSGVQDAIDAKVNGLDYTDSAVTGQYVTKVDEADGKISVARANVSDAVLNGYSKGEKPTSTVITATDKLKDAIAKLEHQIDNAKAAATTKVEKDAEASHLTLTSSTAADGSVTYKIGESDIASKTALDAEKDRAEVAENALDGKISAEVNRAKSAENALDSVVGSVKDASSESRTYGHDSTNYLNGNTTIKADVESVDSLLGKVEGEPASSANTVFSSTNTVAKNISEIKKDLAAFKNKLTLSGKANAYAEVTVVTAEDGTTIEVSAKTQSIATSTKAAEGLADAYDVRTFAVKDVSQESEAATSGVQVKEVGGNKVLDFSGLKIDCGEF